MILCFQIIAGTIHFLIKRINVYISTGILIKTNVKETADCYKQCKGTGISVCQGDGGLTLKNNLRGKLLTINGSAIQWMTNLMW